MLGMRALLEVPGKLAQGNQRCAKASSSSKTVGGEKTKNLCQSALSRKVDSDP